MLHMCVRYQVREQRGHDDHDLAQSRAARAPHARAAAQRLRRAAAAQAAAPRRRRGGGQRLLRRGRRRRDGRRDVAGSGVDGRLSVITLRRSAALARCSRCRDGMWAAHEGFTMIWAGRLGWVVQRKKAARGGIPIRNSSGTLKKDARFWALCIYFYRRPFPHPGGRHTSHTQLSLQKKVCHNGGNTPSPTKPYIIPPPNIYTPPVYWTWTCSPSHIKA